MRRILSKISLALATGLLALGLLAGPASAININLGTAGSYSAFVLYDLDVHNNQTYGAYAVGGDAKLNSYTIGKGATPNTTTLVVGGNLRSNIAPVATGNVKVGGTAQLPAWLDRGNIQENVSNLPVDFAAEKAFLEDLSSTLTLLEATGTAESQWGGISLTGDGASDLQVFNVSGDDLSNASWWAALSSIPDDATIILNVSGSDVSLSGGQQALYDFSDKILFNFYEAEQLAIKNITVEGSILAPYADVFTSGATIDGNLVAKSIGGSFSTTGNSFTPYQGGGAAAPEPGTLVLLASALSGVAGWSRWRVKRKRV